MTNATLVKSPLNYVGGKFKLLPQLLPLFPSKIDTFVDLFGGGANVSANVSANTIFYNESQRQVAELIEYVFDNEVDLLLDKLDAIISEYGLSKTNREGYLRLRNDYNAGTNSPLHFYALITHAFNYSIRFNRNGEFNIAFGKDRSSFSSALRQKFVMFHERIRSSNFVFRNNDFRDFDVSAIGASDLVYCDPPYLISTANYNEQGGWTTQDETDLLALLDTLNERGVRFALSNVLTHKGETNELLVEWSRKYNVTHLSHSYSNCNYQTKQAAVDTQEVLITNYKPEVPAK